MTKLKELGRVFTYNTIDAVDRTEVYMYLGMQHCIDVRVQSTKQMTNH